jgi:probable HAF family extracellular repeat protein
MGGRHWVAAWAFAGLAFAATPVQAAQDFTLVDLGTLGGSGSYGAAVTNGGIVVGCADTASGETHAFIYQAGTMRDLGGGCALAVNDSGVAAGRSAAGDLVVWSVEP